MLSPSEQQKSKKKQGRRGMTMAEEQYGEKAQVAFMGVAQPNHATNADQERLLNALKRKYE